MTDQGSKKNIKLTKNEEDAAEKILDIALKKKEDENTNQKKCSGCGELLDIEAFCNDIHMRDGKKSRCRDCMAKDRITLISVNFKKAPELLEYITKEAEKEFRTPEMQIMYILDLYKKSGGI